MKPKKNLEDCAILLAAKVIGRKWTIFILSELHAFERVHFSELQKHIQNKYGVSISGRVLSDVLSSLEEQGIIDREVEAEMKPVRVSYKLTEKGKDFAVILALMKGWGIKWGSVLQKTCKTHTCVHDAFPMIDVDKARKLFVLELLDYGQISPND